MIIKPSENRAFLYRLVSEFIIGTLLYAYVFLSPFDFRFKVLFVLTLCLLTESFNRLGAGMMYALARQSAGQMVR